MAKRMGVDEEYYRVPVEIEYDIIHCHYNPNWNHTIDTSDSNPLMVYDDFETHYHWEMYLGPFSTIKIAEREWTKFEKQYLESESYKNLRVVRGDIETAKWEKV